jgi:2-iminoacetate synthase ThiH
MAMFLTGTNGKVRDIRQRSIPCSAPIWTRIRLNLDATITDGGELAHSYSVGSNNEVKMTTQQIIALIENAGFDAVERDTVYNRVEKVGA